jgi:hypothetical protein
MRVTDRSDSTGAHGRGAAVAAAALALAVSAAGCAKQSKAPGESTAAAVARLRRTIARPYVTMRADEIQGGGEYDMVPLDMWMPCRWEATFGTFDSKRASGLDGAFFGTSLDARGDPAGSYYGVYASRSGGGLSVSSETEDPISHATVYPGSAFFPGATKIDAAIELDGANVVFYARDASAGGAYQPIGSVPFASQPYPLNPGIEAGGLTGRAEIGYTHLRVVSNSDAPSPITPEHAAVNAILTAMAAVAEARWALDEDPSATASALSWLDTASARMEDAKTAIGAIPAAKPTPRDKALRIVAGAETKVAKSRSKLAAKGEAASKAVVKELGPRFFDLVRAADAVLPQDLRDSLPGTHHHLK